MKQIGASLHLVRQKLKMTEIESKYQEFVSTPFPDGLGREEVLGIDLVMLDADTAGLIDKFIVRHGKLTKSDFELLVSLMLELKMVMKQLNGLSKEYFSTLLNLSERVVDQMILTKKFIP